jgi:hypothetical protein
VFESSPLSNTVGINFIDFVRSGYYGFLGFNPYFALLPFLYFGSSVIKINFYNHLPLHDQWFVLNKNEVFRRHNLFHKKILGDCYL